MASKILFAAFALANLAASMPSPFPRPRTEQIYGTENMTPEEVYNITTTIDRRMLAAWGCVGQSCIAADYAGSSGRPARAKPQGGGMADTACVMKYSAAAKAAGVMIPNGPTQDSGVSTMLMQGINALWNGMLALTGSTDKGTFTGTCAKNILIWAKGTFEPGAYGVFVGPSFTAGLPMTWSTTGIEYDANVPGDFCLGLPGGMVAKDVINQAAQKCPEANLYLAGYSQGAMVARNGIAYANPEAKTHVKGLVTFGDPFNGAPVAGWNGPIRTFCNSGDGVCSGNFEIAMSHLSYGMDTSAGLGQAALLGMASGMVKGGGGGIGGLLGGLFG